MFIRIIPLKFNNLELIESIAPMLEKRFGVPVIIGSDSWELTGGHDPIRNQLNSNWVLEQLLVRYPANNSKLLALTDRDLYSPVLTYVFGEATLGGRAAVVSSHRFHNEFYGLRPNTKIVRKRLFREVVHELGHTYGLIHCRYQGCVMYSSSYVEDIDMKPSSFCKSCNRILSSSKSLR